MKTLANFDFVVDFFIVRMSWITGASVTALLLPQLGLVSVPHPTLGRCLAILIAGMSTLPALIYSALRHPTMAPTFIRHLLPPGITMEDILEKEQERYRLTRYLKRSVLEQTRRPILLVLGALIVGTLSARLSVSVVPKYLVGIICGTSFLVLTFLWIAFFIRLRMRFVRLLLRAAEHG